MTTPPKTADGTRTIWATASGLTVSTSTDGGIVLYRGQHITLTPEQVAFTRDRNGDTWLDLDADAQIRRWGEQRFQEGLPPEGILVGGDDTKAVADQKAEAIAELAFITSKAERDAAADAITARFGRGNPSGQRTVHRG